MKRTPSDPKIPFLGDALNVEVAQRVLSGTLGELRVKSAELMRHRAGRRALISYSIDSSEGFGEVGILGKIRARGVDRRSCEVQRELHEAGFPVPRVLGVVPPFSMWLQEKLPGVEVTRLLTGEDGERAARGAAKLVKSLHGSGIEPRRKPHTLADELAILEERLPLVTERESAFTKRIERLLEGSRRLVTAVGETTKTTGIHRDFYGDQILVSGGDAFLLDLDLYCEGDPALDAGNFLAHVAEQSLREYGDAAAMRRVEDAFLDEFAGGDEELAGRIVVYRTLTLVRHVWISARIPERRRFTARILSLCEELPELQIAGYSPISSRVRVRRTTS